MTDDANKSAETKPATPTARTTSAVGAKPATRARVSKASAPAAGSASATSKAAPVKAASAVAKKTVVRPPVVRKSPLAKKAAHEPEPFVAKDKKAGKPAKMKKAKLVRDSFTMPDGEYALIASLKKRCLDAGMAAKKSEILRAAIANLAKLSDASVVSAVRRLETIKTGRPAKGAK